MDHEGSWVFYLFLSVQQRGTRRVCGFWAMPDAAGIPSASLSSLCAFLTSLCKQIVLHFHTYSVIKAHKYDFSVFACLAMSRNSPKLFSKLIPRCFYLTRSFSKLRMVTTPKFSFYEMHFLLRHFILKSVLISVQLVCENTR